MDLLRKNKQALKKALDYNKDNIVNTKDIVDLQKDIESQIKKMSEQLKQQYEDAINNN